MSLGEFQRKAIYFVLFFGAVLLILISLPILESALREFVLPQFDLFANPEGKIFHTNGTPAGVVADTASSLFINIIHILKIFLWMALVISVIRMLTYLIFTTALRNVQQSEISSLLKTVFSVILYVVSFFIIFQSQYPGVQLAPLFTGSAIIGIVVGLALQDTLGNLFAGIALQADQPFQVGDVVTISRLGSGVVESVSWRGVKIRTFQNKLLVMSNAVMGKETIEVAPRDNLNARLVHFSSLYTVSPTKTINAIREAVRTVENVSAKYRPVVRISNLGESGLEYEVKYWAEDYKKYNDTDALIRERIWYVFNRENIAFPFPARTIHQAEQIQHVSADDFVSSAISSLHQVSIFAPLSASEIEKLAESSESRIYAPREKIVAHGQVGDSMFVVLSGSVSVQIPSKNTLKTINTLRANDYFGEMSLLNGEPRSATVVAEEETEVLSIGKESIKPILQANPELVASISKLVEDRRKLLASEIAEETIKASGDKKILSSIKKFFGLN